jgi:hypothetical protein
VEATTGLAGQPALKLADKKKPTAFGWLFLLQIEDLPEFDVERAMGIEHVEHIEQWISHFHLHD